jgi:N-methylhydantoinase A
MKNEIRLAADIGGTFTDIVLERGKERWSGKVLTTSDAPERGVLEGVAALLTSAGIAAQDVDVFIHGSTLATNALIERKGAVTAFITTEGFRDILEQGYEKRYDHYDLMIDRPVPLVPRELRLTVRERMAIDGTIMVPLDLAQVDILADAIVKANVKAVAIGLLHAYAHDEHEVRLRDALAQRLGGDVTICVSSEVAPEIREYERFSTTVANAYVRPLMAGYLKRLGEQLAVMKLNAPLYLMMSGGGLTTLETARRFPIRLVESGPAGGAILASEIAAECGLDHVLSFDMGGTTAKICLLDHGEPERARKFEVARAYKNMKGSGIPVRIPVIEMVEIGAGGGSIARVDALSRIVVGPDSAGSTPGPVCYGRGGVEPAVTDANVVLGKIDPTYFAGGKIALDSAAATRALADRIGAPLKLDGLWPAAGVAEIVEENMANAARVHAIERGRDIAACTMIAFGGGAPLHACALADKVGISRVIVPRGAGVASAIGFLRAPIAYEVTRSLSVSLDQFDHARVNALLDDMTQDAHAVVAPAVKTAKISVQIIADCRYVGQGHEVRVEVPVRTLKVSDGQVLKATFEKLYAQVYGLTIPGQAAEAITWSVTVSSPRVRPKVAAKVGSRGGLAAKTKRQVFDPVKGRTIQVPVYWRFDLKPGTKMKGPAIIAEDETSTVVGTGYTASIDALGYIVMERRS